MDHDGVVMATIIIIFVVFLFVMGFMMSNDALTEALQDAFLHGTGFIAITRTPKGMVYARLDPQIVSIGKKAQFAPHGVITSHPDDDDVEVFASTMKEKNAPKAMTIRLSADQAEKLETVANVENRFVSDVIRAAIAEHIESRKRDPSFQDGLKDRIQRAQRLLDR